MRRMPKPGFAVLKAELVPKRVAIPGERNQRDFVRPRRLRLGDLRQAHSIEPPMRAGRFVARAIARLASSVCRFAAVAFLSLRIACNGHTVRQSWRAPAAGG